MIVNRKILAQGDRDGACYLYAIANSVQSLSNKPVSQAQWGNCIGKLPYKLDDFLAGRGTEKLDNNTIYFETICNEFFIKMNFDAEVHSLFDIVSSADLQSRCELNSVILATIYGGAHWVSIVDVNGDNIYMACSAVALSGKTPYREDRSPRLNRLFNLKIKFDELALWRGYGLLISQRSKFS